MSESQYLGIFSKEFLKHIQDLFCIYLVEHKYLDIIRILAASNAASYYPVVVSYEDLKDFSGMLADCVSRRYSQIGPVLNRAVVTAQEQLVEGERARFADEKEQTLYFGVHSEVSVKRCVNVRISNLSIRTFGRQLVPTDADCGAMVVFRGIVMRLSETQQATRCYTFQCQRCASLVSVATRFETSYAECAPSSCTNASCDSNQFMRIDAERLARTSSIPRANRTTGDYAADNDPQVSTFRDIRELRVQEKRDDRRRFVPNSITVVLEDDLVDVPIEQGDEVEVCGVVVRRFASVPMKSNLSAVNELVIRATFVRSLRGDSRITSAPCSTLMRVKFSAFWRRFASEPFRARQLIVSSICPSLRGLNIVKLALALVLAGGNLNTSSPINSVVKKSNENESDADLNSTSINDTTNAGQPKRANANVNQQSSTYRGRGDCHLLLVGDAGTGKSEFLAFARAVVPHAVLVSGTSLSSAGLTASVSADRSAGGPQLEAGALVHADGSVCCIDEFAFIKPTDQTALLQAMEDQIVYFDKAGATSKMNARCSVIAATNPRGSYRLTENLTVNTGLNGPLISRFDLVFVILDLVNSEWDQVVADRIVDLCTDPAEEENAESIVDLVEPEKVGRQREESVAPVGNFSLDLNRTWTLDELRAYFMLIRTTRPAWRNPDAHLVIQSYFEECRTKMTPDLLSSDRRTPRLFMSLMRLAEAHARLLSPGRPVCEVLVEDAVCAICLMEASIQSCAIRKPDRLTGLVDTSAANRILLSEQTPLGATNEYRQQATVMLNRLGLTNILDTELKRLDALVTDYTSASTSASAKAPETPIEKEVETFDFSAFFDDDEEPVAKRQDVEFGNENRNAFDIDLDDF